MPRLSLLVILLCGLTNQATAALHPRGLTMLYDDATNLTWLNSFTMGAGTEFDDGFSATDGLMTYTSAQAWLRQLSILNDDTGEMVSNWRLPEVRFESPPSDGIHFEGIVLPSGLPNSNFAWMGTLFDPPPPNRTSILTVEGHLVNDGGDWPALAWAVSFSGGGFGPAVAGGGAPMQGFAFGVHDGDVSIVPLPGTVLLLLPAIAVMGSLCQRRQGTIARACRPYI